MKKLTKILIPSLSVVATAATITPLVVSCSTSTVLAEIEWDLSNGQYQPSVLPKPAGTTGGKGTEFYFTDIQNTPKIMCEDFLQSNSRQSPTNDLTIKKIKFTVNKITPNENKTAYKVDFKILINSVDEAQDPWIQEFIYQNVWLVARFSPQATSDPVKWIVCYKNFGDDKANFWNDKDWTLTVKQKEDISPWVENKLDHNCKDDPILASMAISAVQQFGYYAYYFKNIVE